MFGQIVEYQLRPGKSIEFKRLFLEKILPTLRKQHGFLEGIRMASDTMADRNIKAESLDRAASITIWTTEVDLRAYESDFGKQMEEVIEPLLQSKPRTIEFPSVDRSTTGSWAAAASG